MTLILSIIKSPSSVSLSETQKAFTEQGGTVGRGASNDFVLADPDRFLSSSHCSISFNAGRYYLTDTSTNGTFLNAAPEPVGKGVTVMLAHSDTVEVGDYQFRVDIDDQSGALGASSSDSDPLDPFSSEPSAVSNSEDPFGSSQAKSAMIDDPLVGDVFGSQPLPGAIEGELEGFGAGASDGATGDPFATDPFATTGAHDLLSDVSQESFDPLAALDGAGSKLQGNRNSVEDDLLGLTSDFPASPDNLFGSPRSDISAPSHSDGAGALEQAVSWPEPAGTNMIPDDWDDFGSDLDSNLSGADHPGGSPADFPVPQAEQSPAPVKPLGQPVDDYFSQKDFPGDRSNSSSTISEQKAGGGPIDDPLEALLQERPLESGPDDPFSRSSEKPDSGAHDASPFDAAMSEAKIESVQHDRKIPPHHSNQFRQDVPNDARPAKAARASVSSSNSVSGQSALLSAMGIDVSTLSAQDVLDIEKSVGELMPVIVSGMMQVLRSRTSIKNEFRMNVTTIQPVENNPLKFSADTSDAVDNMFVRKSGAYKKPVEAFQEGFDGIGEHQVAIIAGIRAAFEAMMNRFNPSQLEKQFDKYNKGVTLPGMQKAKYWNSYIDHYRGLVDNMENSFQYLFGDEFVQAYEDQLRILVAERQHKR